MPPNVIDLKERIAINAGFTVEERDWLLGAINYALDDGWTPRPAAPVEVTGERSPLVADVFALPLLFHAAGPWNATRAAEWLRITGTTEATTRVMCNHFRWALDEIYRSATKDRT